MDFINTLDYQNSDFVTFRNFIKVETFVKDISNFLIKNSHNVIKSENILIIKYMIEKMINELNVCEILESGKFINFMIDRLNPEILNHFMNNILTKNEKIIFKSKIRPRLFKNLKFKMRTTYNINNINFELVDWIETCSTSSDLKLLTDNYEKINWYALSNNPHVIELLAENLNKVDWFNLTLNPGAIRILENNLDKVEWTLIAYNPSDDILRFLNDHLNDETKWLDIWYSMEPIRSEIMQILKNKLTSDIENMMIEQSNFDARASFEDAVLILKDYLDFIDWHAFSKNPGAVDILKDNLDRINWSTIVLNKNPAVIEIFEANPEKVKYRYIYRNINILTYDYIAIKKNKINIFEYFYHPKYLYKYLELYEDIDNEEHYINWFLFERTL